MAGTVLDGLLLVDTADSATGGGMVTGFGAATGADAGGTGAAAGGGVATGGAGDDTGAGVGAVAGAETEEACAKVKLAKAATASTLSTVTMIGSPILTSEPSGTKSFATMKSSWASKAILALSVSTSAKAVPGLIVSPLLQSHFPIVPTCIVGDRAGIPTT